MGKKRIKTELMLEVLKGEPDVEQQYFHYLGGILRSAHWLEYSLEKMRQNALHYAAKRVVIMRQNVVALCGKTCCILRQNVLHFAAKRIALCGKTHCIMPQSAQ